MLLFGRNFERSPLAFLDQVPLRYLGRVSYGFHLSHLVIGGEVRRLIGSQPQELPALVAGVATLLAATVSWYALERPIIRLGRHRTRSASCARD
jgi:peptidoglycan/LPS O-acetylase OafA/YrhL